MDTNILQEKINAHAQKKLQKDIYDAFQLIETNPILSKIKILANGEYLKIAGYRQSGIFRIPDHEINPVIERETPHVTNWDKVEAELLKEYIEAETNKFLADIEALRDYELFKNMEE